MPKNKKKYELTYTKVEKQVAAGQIAFTNVKFVHGKDSFEGVVYVCFSQSGSPLGVCGQRYLGNFGLFTQGACKQTRNGEVVAHPSCIWLIADLAKAPGATEELRNYLLPRVVEELMGAIEDPKYTYIMGGRINPKESFIYCGTVGHYIAKNKIGTITCSHLHHNPLYNTVTEAWSSFSVQQVFVWSPPKVETIPINRRYVGVFEQKDHGKSSLEKMMARFKKPAGWALFRPTYYLTTKKVKEEIKANEPQAG